MKIHQLVEQAFLAGYRHGVESFAIWRGGMQLVGCLERPLSEVFKHAPEDCKDAYRLYLEKQQEKHDGVERPIILQGDEDQC